MSSRLILQLGGLNAIVDAVPLDREAFARFGDVIENPRPQLHPSAAHQSTSQSPLSLPFDGVSANQGSAIKYQHVSRMVNLYDQAPSGRPGIAVMNMFVCAARQLVRSSELGLAREPKLTGAAADKSLSLSLPRHGRGHGHGHAQDLLFPVTVLERHPYTTQTFTPLTADPSKRFLVIVAPSLPPSEHDLALPCPMTKPASGAETRPLPGRGLPDVSRLRAFIATSKQAVTYGAGTWHAPMVALGPAATAVDFLVVQFANGEATEDCQEVYLPGTRPRSPSSTDKSSDIMVRLPRTLRSTKL